MLDLDYNGLSGTVPKELGNLKYLIYFDVVFNRLAAIPEEVCALVNDGDLLTFHVDCGLSCDCCDDCDDCGLFVV